jgi:Uma2 family endonuclease
MGLPIAKLTLTEFLAWEADQPDRHEFYRGEVFAMVGGTARHNRVILNLAARLADHLDGTGCQVFAETMKVQLADEAVLYPDVLVTCGKALAGDEQVVTDPKLIIEVLSPSTMGYDKRNKFILYRSLAPLREYVLIDPASREVEVFTLTPEGWLLSDQTRASELTLSSIGAVLPMAAVFKGVESESV